MEDYEYLNSDSDIPLDIAEMNMESTTLVSNAAEDQLLAHVNSLANEVAELKEALVKEKKTNEQLTMSMKTKVKFELGQRSKILELETEVARLTEILH